MIKEEFKRFLSRIIVRLIILFIFLVICYFLGSSNVKADTIPVNSNFTVSRIQNNVNELNNPNMQYYLGWNWYPNQPNQSNISNTAWIWDISSFEHYNDYYNKSIDLTFIVHITGLNTQLNNRSYFGRLGGTSADNNVMCEINDIREFTSYTGNTYGYDPSGTSRFLIVQCKNYKITETTMQFQLRSDIGIESSKFDLRNTFSVNQNLDYSISEIQNETKKTNDILKDDNTTTANTNAMNFFNNFNDPTQSTGLSAIIGAPLTLINNLVSGTCSPIRLSVPFLNNVNIDLPCMSTIYSQHFGTFLNVYRIITFGIISYWVIVRCFGIVKNLVDPDDDKIEVLDL